MCIGWLYKWNGMLDTYGPHEVIWFIDKLAIRNVESILQYWWQNLAHINATKKMVTSFLKQNTPSKLHHQCLRSGLSDLYWIFFSDWSLLAYYRMNPFLSRTVPDNKEVIKQQMSGSSFILKELSHILWGGRKD